jgi:hypothetical protein
MFDVLLKIVWKKKDLGKRKASQQGPIQGYMDFSAASSMHHSCRRFLDNNLDLEPTPWANPALVG